ncbi:hypothetical protein AK812_SmicGene3806 [Symbiodinium microadriaticum]|uniref:Uncharacterized protein n=1 Tax=Symbiodinium microadriaticum TaxID=2951 RepID=A0A1Q9EXV6_SYMMI|nr:hypothetical protein AK812_SmicGene3806 [Symbiodinium microadriaticum]
MAAFWTGTFGDRALSYETFNLHPRLHLDVARKKGSFTLVEVTTKVPSYDGRSSWFTYADAIDDWCEITELDTETRCPIVNRSGHAQLGGVLGEVRDALENLIRLPDGSQGNGDDEV